MTREGPRRARLVTVGIALASLGTSLFVVPAVARDEGSIDRAELDGGRLRVEGDEAEANAIVTVTSAESSASSRADGDGEFRVEASNSQASNCRATVSDGATSVQVTLDGCTPTAPTTTVPPTTVSPTTVPATTVPPSTTVTPTTVPATTVPPTTVAATTLPPTTLPPTTLPPTTLPPTTTLPTTVSPGDGVVAALTVSPTAVAGGETAQSTVTLAAAVGTPTLASLSSIHSSNAIVPVSVTVPAGALSATFPINTVGAFNDITTVIGASAGGRTAFAELTIFGVPAVPPLSLTFDPPQSFSNQLGTATVTLVGIAPHGTGVALTSSNPEVLKVPPGVRVLPGDASATFDILTFAVVVPTDVTVTASAFGSSASGTITVLPGLPPGADEVTITRAEWRGGRLRIEARSSNPDAVLRVYLGGTTSFMFPLTDEGGGRYSAQRNW